MWIFTEFRVFIGWMLVFEREMKKNILYIISLSLFVCCGVFAETQNNKRGLNWSGPTKVDAGSFLRGKYRAVIIGNNQYVDEKGIWHDLKTAVRDAETIAQLLSSQYGFEDVSILRNANRKEILDTFKQLSDRVEPDDNVLVYYAGHGYLEDNQKRGYWIPADGRGYDSSTFIRNSTIRDEINIIGEKTKHTLLISDSCFSGSLLRGGNRGPTPFDLNNSYYRKVGSKKSVQVLAAGGNEYVDDNYRNSGHSPFTYFLINELKSNQSKFISLSEVATNVIKAVANNVEQTPEAGVLQGAGDELGEFIFARLSLDENSVEVIVGKNIKPGKIKEVEKVTKSIRDLSDNSQEPSLMPALRF